MENIIQLVNVTKVFKAQMAVDDVSFSIKKGEVVAILGPNGAGKSTTIMMMLGLLVPTSGHVQLFSHDPRSKGVRERIGAMLQDVSLIDALNVKEVIRLFRSYYPKPLDFDELVKITGLQQADMKKKANKLSGGQKRRLSFALALAGNPDLLFFDEPTVGMDVVSRRQFWETVHALKKQGKTIIFPTHYLQEADEFAERILLFQKGKIIADGSAHEIKRRLSKQSVSFITEERTWTEKATELSIVSDMRWKGNRVEIRTEDTDTLLKYLFDNNIEMSGIQVEHGRLDEAFVELTEDNREVM